MTQEQRGNQTYQTVCPNCAGSNPASASFCAHCGQPARPESRICSNCLTNLPPDAQFCAECGTAASIPMGWDLPAEEEYMGFWIRAAAGLIDAAVIMAVGVMIVMAMGIYLGPPLTDLLVGIASLVYYVALTGLKGQTLGKMALGIMVVNARGEPPGILRAAFREILGKLVSEIAIFLGYLWIGWDRKKRGWHDHIASTYVVRAPGRRKRPAKPH